MKLKLSAALLLALALLSACGQKTEAGPQLDVYRVVVSYYQTGGTLATPEHIPFTPEIGEMNLAVSAFNAAPGRPDLKSPLPEGGRIVGYELRGGILRLETEGCDGLEGIDLTLLRGCAVLTFCALDGVNAVSLYSAGEELCPPLSEDDILAADLSVQMQ